MLELEPDVVAVVGDLVDGSAHLVEPMLPELQRVQAPLGVFAVLGNHEFRVGSEDKGRVLTTLGLQGGYYDFAYHPWRFIVLDGTDLSLFAAEKGSERYKEAKSMLRKLRKGGIANALMKNGGLSTEQMTWLKQTLEKAQAAGEKVVTTAGVT